MFKTKNLPRLQRIDDPLLNYSSDFQGLENSQFQGNFAREPRRLMTIGRPQSDLEEVNPLARIAGSYANDPHWDEFAHLMEESRLELDEAMGLSE